MSVLSPTTIETLEKRKAGVLPNYDLKHTCSKCGLQSQCPDRYLKNSCGPSDFYGKKGREFSYTCLPCMAGFSPEDRTVWYEAHSI